MPDPDFDALRASRNAAVRDHIERLAQQLGVPAAELTTTFDPNSCYCACGTHGPCEHKWDGDLWVSDDGLLHSATCSRCGMTAFSHDMRYAP